jgi:DNA polymerase-3 subunit gamma/tau
VVQRVISSGHEPRRFVEDLLERLRDLIVISAAGEHASAALRDLPADQLERMQSQATHLGAFELSRSADLASVALTEMAGATSPRLQLELLMARLLLPAVDDSRTGLGARLDRLERGFDAGAAAAVIARPMEMPPGRSDAGPRGGAADGASAGPPSAQARGPVESGRTTASASGTARAEPVRTHAPAAVAPAAATRSMPTTDTGTSTAQVPAEVPVPATPGPASPVPASPVLATP